jgi:O-antigen/teichoic acid export membrane protein
MALQIQLLRTRLRDPLQRTAWSLILSTVVTSCLGVAFWAIAARTFPAAVVGHDGALIAAMTALSMLCQLNLTNSLVRFLPQIAHRIGRRILTAYLAAGSFSLAAGAAFVLIAPSLDPSFRFLTGDTGLALAFAFSVAAWSLFTLEDSVLTALGFAVWVPPENAVFSAAKILALALFASLAPRHGVFLAWIAPAVLIVPVINWLIARRVVPHATTVQRGARGVVPVFGWRRLFAFLVQDFLGTIAAQLAVLAIPLIVLARFGSAQTAYFYVPFTLISAFDLLASVVAISLTTTAARAPERVAELTRTVVRRFLLGEIPIIAMIIIAAPLVLDPFGHQYVEHSTTVLRLLAAGSLCRATLFVYAALGRLRGNAAGVALPQTVLALLLIAFASSLGGIDGVALGWVASFALVTLAVSPWLLTWVRKPRLAVGGAAVHLSEEV